MRLALSGDFSEDLVDTPFEYSKSDDEDLADPTQDRTKKLCVRINDVVDVNLYSNTSHDDVFNNSGSENSELEKEEFNSENEEFPCENEDMGHDDDVLPECENDSVLDGSTGEETKDPQQMIEGKTMDDCIAMMEDFDFGSDDGSEGGLGFRTKSFLNIFFGSSSKVVCVR